MAEVDTYASIEAIPHTTQLTNSQDDQENTVIERNHETNKYGGVVEDSSASNIKYTPQHQHTIMMIRTTQVGSNHILSITVVSYCMWSDTNKNHLNKLHTHTFTTNMKYLQ